MQTADNNLPITVELQDMMSYSPVGVIGLVSLLALVILIVVIALIIKLKKKKKEVVPHIPSEHRVKMAKEKYHKLLTELEMRYQTGKVSERGAYQELSKYIRHFVYNVSGIKVHNYTLEEIGRINMPNLYYLIAECYTPEFAAYSRGDVSQSIRKAREVIETWN